MSEPIRVLQMIGSLERGGSQAMVLNLYKAIDRNRIQFDFVLDHPELNQLQSTVEKLGAKIYYMPAFKGTNLVEIINSWDHFFEIHSEYKILHSHVRSYASFYIPIAKKYGVKTIIHSHSTSNGNGISALIKAMLQYPLRYEADYFFGCSKMAGEWLFGKKVVQSTRYFLLKNAVDTKKYKYNSKIRADYRKLLGVSENSTVYVHVGRLHEAKNHMFLLDLFKELKQQRPESVLVIVGDGKLRDTIEKKITELDIEQNVRLLGARDDVPEIFQASDCFLFPSKWEGLPVTVVEAQAAGLPCFVSDKVTKEVNLSELVVNLPIDKGTRLWVEEICKADYQRKNVSDKIKKAGFDIEDSAEWLMHFYEGIINE